MPTTSSGLSSHPTKDAGFEVKSRSSQTQMADSLPTKPYSEDATFSVSERLKVFKVTGGWRVFKSLDTIHLEESLRIQTIQSAHLCRGCHIYLIYLLKRNERKYEFLVNGCGSFQLSYIAASF